MVVFMTLSPQQLEQRKHGITATDIAAISGHHPYRAPIDVWMDKTGRAQPFAGNLRTKWGNLLEPIIRDDYAERHGVRIEVPGTLAHPSHPWIMATPDGICYRPSSAYPCNGLEVKTHSFRAAEEYGDPGTDEVPGYELIQSTWNMYVSGLERWDLVAFIDGQPAEYCIRRDDELIGMLHEGAEKFMHDYVRTDTPPPPDGTKSYDTYLSTAHPYKGNGYVDIDRDSIALDLVQHLRIARDRLTEAEADAELLEQKIKVVIGEHDGVEWTELSGGKRKRPHVSFKQAQSTLKTDYYAAWQTVLNDAQLAMSLILPDPMELVAVLKRIADPMWSITPHTVEVPGSRRLNIPRAWRSNTNG